jgi:membrane protease YdiL (CAAX protease family)
MAERLMSIRLRMEKLNDVAYISVFVAIKFLVAYLFTLVALEYLGRSIMSDTPEWGTRTQAFITIVLLGPLVETYFCQYLFFKYLLRHLSGGVIILLSAIVFALLHAYNSVYVLYAFFSGLLLSLSYYYRLNSHPFVFAFLIHSVYNLLTFLLNNR